MDAILNNFVHCGRPVPAALPTNMPEKRINFEINLTKMKWCPKHVSEVPQTISRAFERDIQMEHIQPVIGTDHVKEWILKEDKDIPEFYNAPTMMQEWIAEKVIKVKIPDGIMPKSFVPKKCKILATGEKVAKFFGEDNVSTRTVEASLKIFDCGHFYLKQTLPGSGASPHWTIFEGRWRATERGLKLEYLLRYSWQLSRKPYMEFAIEAVRSDLMTTLAWDGETEKQLNGNLPAIVGTDDFFWAELVREGDTKGAAKLRWNEDCPEPPSWTRKNEQCVQRAEGAELDTQQPPRLPAEPEVEAATSRASTTDGSDLHHRRRAPAAAPRSPSSVPSGTCSSAVSAPAAPPQEPAAKLPVRPGISSRGGGAVGLEEDTESALPLYVGFGLFVVMAAAFAYFAMEEHS